MRELYEVQADIYMKVIDVKKVLDNLERCVIFGEGVSVLFPSFHTRVYDLRMLAGEYQMIRASKKADKGRE